ncbi:MAG: diaminopimelate epimerase [Acidimicrobiia bacterium]|nr:diaminopimelate epimerase [Acidimicrobiia bacterium]
MTPLQLSKLHATGNDFLVLVALGDGWRPDAADVERLCDRHRGVGADGFITLVDGDDGADAAMVLRNADGGVAEMSGNGMRTLAWVADREGLVRGDELIVDTGGGRRTVELERDGSGAVVGATVDMGPATFVPGAIPVSGRSPFGLTATFHGTEYGGDAVGMGNPHWVLLVDDPDAARVESHGPRLSTDPRFPGGANVEFVAITDRRALRMRVFERGVGETLSCGTGACAAAAVTHRRGLTDAELDVVVRGGTLRVNVGDTIRLGGPVRHVFDVTVDPETIAP